MVNSVKYAIADTALVSVLGGVVGLTAEGTRLAYGGLFSSLFAVNMLALHISRTMGEHYKLHKDSMCKLDLSLRMLFSAVVLTIAVSMGILSSLAAFFAGLAMVGLFFPTSSFEIISNKTRSLKNWPQLSYHPFLDEDDRRRMATIGLSAP